MPYVSVNENREPEGPHRVAEPGVQTVTGERSAAGLPGEKLVSRSESARGVSGNLTAGVGEDGFAAARRVVTSRTTRAAHLLLTRSSSAAPSRMADSAHNVAALPVGSLFEGTE